MRSFFVIVVAAFSLAAPLRAEFKAGSAIVDVTPKEFPVLVNGGMTSRSMDTVKTPVNARCLAFSDGEESIVVVVVDSCMMPRDLLDKAKKIASEKSGVPVDHMLISATHTHTAPSCMGALGTDADPAYTVFLTKKLVEAILAPLETLKPARIGWGEIDAGDYTALRRWVIHPGAVQEDPFGNPTVRANMHAASNWDNVIGPSGPEDPMLSMISVQTVDGEPIGLLANFSMHYFGDKDISADYFGLFSEGIQERLAPEDTGFVAMMSHGCSGDIYRRDYEKSPDRRSKTTIEEYSAEMIDLALTAHESIDYHRPESIAMAEARLDLAYRVPDRQRLEWAQRVVEETGDRLPENKAEIYAREQVLLHERQRTEIVVQALRLGEKISIATTPNETYAITGLKIKAAGPTDHTMVIELANGGDGYIPPPEQHLLGGYNTWPARSAGLEVEAEPKITETAIGLLEKVTERQRTDRRPGHGPAAEHILSLKPRAYYRLDEFNGPRAIDASPNHLDAIYEPRVLFHLPGPQSSSFSKEGENRAAHFVDDRLRVRIPNLVDRNFTVSLWFWSGSPEESFDGEVEWIFSRGHDYGSDTTFDQVGITENAEGKRVLVQTPTGDRILDSEEVASIERWTWNHLAFAREGDTAKVFLNGKHLSAATTSTPDEAPETFFFGGSSGNENNFEGRLDEIAVFGRPLSSDEIQQLASP
ncbi:MAG: LamG-like jellyroll fold domain-containing protein [Verrucomicrobiales bacterium]